MPPLKTQGIILARRDLNEWDRLVTIYTEKLGKVLAKVTSARKIKSKLSPHLEPFFCSDLLLAPGKRYYLVASARIINSYAAIRQDNSLIKVASSIIRLVDQTTKEKTVDPFVFQFLNKSLSYLANGRIKPSWLALIFAWKLISHLGYKPELTKCLGCNKKAQPSDNYFSINQGGLVCSACRQSAREYFKLSNDSLKILRKIQEAKLDYLAKLKLPLPVIIQLNSLTKQFVNYHLEKSAQI
ncbi:DNA repair protein RecO [Patescibacteria group bacterium]|nr:DNA repair protein RecO [Patescibacteria group bacterium]